MTRSVQLRLSRPARKVRMERLTRRQAELLHRLRYEAVPLEASLLGAAYGYAYPRAACDRLVARGLAVKVSPGVYRARVVRERRP